MREHLDDVKADEYISNIIQAECKGLTTQHECDSNKRCFWDNKKCKRDARTVTVDEQSAMSNAMISKTPAEQIQSSPHSSSHIYTNFVVEEVSLDDPILKKLDDTHFLKQRKIQILSQEETDARIERRQTSLSTYGLGRGELYSPDFFADKAHFGKLEDDKYVEKINKLPIFLYASERPVQVILPEQYTGVIGSVSFNLETNIPIMLILPELGPGRELLSFDFIGKKNTIEFLSLDQTLGTTYRAPPGWSQPTKSADYVTYTADEKKSHPTLRTGQYWQELGNGLYTILADAGGGRISRRSRRRTRNVRKHKIRSRKHKHHKRTQRNRSRPQSRVRK